MRNYLVIFILFTTILFASKQELTVTILPQKYFVQKIVKDKFDINVMIKPGSSPHNFEPKASQMKALSNSKIYFMIGEPSEKAWISRFKQNAKNTLFVDTTIGVEKIAMQEHTHHNNKDDNHQDEDGLDPHIWLDPISVKNQAKNIYEAIIKIDEKNSEFYKSNYDEFINELEILDKDIKNILVTHENRAFMVFHPSWGYFAKRYNLKQISIEIEGKEPKPNELLKLITNSKEHNIKIVFVSPQFSQKSAKTISQNIGADVVSIDPLNEDWKNNLLFVVNEISKSYKK